MSGNKKPEADRRFAKFGTVSFTATTKVNDFIGYLQEGKVCGTKVPCLRGGVLPAPGPVPQVPGTRLRSNGSRFKAAESWPPYSELKYAPTGFTEDLPYAIAVLDMGDYKLFGRIGDVPLAEVRVGMELVPQWLTNYLMVRSITCSTGA